MFVFRAIQTNKTIHVWLVKTNLQGLSKTNMQLTKNTPKHIRSNAIYQ